VKPWVEDVTADLTPGGLNPISYQGLYQGADYDPQPGSGGGFAARITMNSYLVHSIGMAETDCQDTVDNDLDGATDCEDTGCWADPACIDDDTDGDGTINRDDCDPLEGGAFDEPDLTDPIVVTKPTANPDTAVVSWMDLVPLAGTGTTYDVVTGSLTDLHQDQGFGSATCLKNQSDNFYTETQQGSTYYFVRAENFCGSTPLGRNVGGICD
jgi:hypothetical protein